MLASDRGIGRTSGRHRERQPDGVPGRRVRVLADDQHADLVEGPRERAQHVRARRQVAAARGELGAQELAHLRDHRLDGRQRLRPARPRRSPTTAFRPPAVLPVSCQGRRAPPTRPGEPRPPPHTAAPGPLSTARGARTPAVRRARPDAPCDGTRRGATAAGQSRSSLSSQPGSSPTSGVRGQVLRQLVDDQRVVREAPAAVGGPTDQLGDHRGGDHLEQHDEHQRRPRWPAPPAAPCPGGSATGPASAASSRPAAGPAGPAAAPGRSPRAGTTAPRTA